MTRAQIVLDGADVSEDGVLDSVQDRARATVAMWRLGVELKRKNVRIAEPHLTPDQVEERVRQWLQADE